MGCLLGLFSCQDEDKGPLDYTLVAFSNDVRLASESDWVLVNWVIRDQQLKGLDSMQTYIPRNYQWGNVELAEQWSKMNIGEIQRWHLTAEQRKAIPYWEELQPYYWEIQPMLGMDSTRWKEHLVERAQMEDITEPEVIGMLAKHWPQRREGLAWRWIRHGEGPLLTPGERITVSWVTLLPHGREIVPLLHMTFPVGEKDQVVPALQWIMPHLHDGDSIEVLSQSAYSFGEFGSVDGSIPPHTPILYKLGVHLEGGSHD